MRFRLKTDFLTYARDQIRGGLWYKPSWWEAVQKVPPTPPVGRITKREIPQLKFAEDKLLREFTARNPALKKFDDRNVAEGKAADTVAAQFVRQQLHHMRNNEPVDAAYAKATAWLVEHGKQVLTKADPTLKSAGQVPAAAVPPAELFERVMAQQAKLVESVLSASVAGQDDKLRGLPPYKDYRSAEHRAALGRRAASSEVSFPSGYTTADEKESSPASSSELK